MSSPRHRSKARVREIRVVVTREPRRNLTIHCSSCFHINSIPIQKFYDGFEGDFVCEQCSSPLEHLHEKLDEE